MTSRTSDKNKRTVIVRRIEASEEPHGGAWKVAYADFVTAMMAFFLLMWLVNFVDDDTRRGLTNYFSSSPSGFTPTQTGSGGLFGGTTENLLEGFLRQTGDDVRRHATPAEIAAEDERDGERARPTVMWPDGEGGQRSALVAGDIRDAGLPGGQQDMSPDRVAEQAHTVASLARAAAEALRQEQEAREDQRFEQAIETMRSVLEQDPALRQITRQVLFQIEPEGLRIHFTDAGERPMFDTGSATPNQWLVSALRALLPPLQGLPNALAISGHTDSMPFRGGTARQLGFEHRARDRCTARSVALRTTPGPDRNRGRLR